MRNTDDADWLVACIAQQWPRKTMSSVQGVGQGVQGVGLQILFMQMAGDVV